MDMVSSLIFTLPKIRTSKKYQMVRSVQRSQKEREDIWNFKIYAEAFEQ